MQSIFYQTSELTKLPMSTKSSIANEYKHIISCMNTQHKAYKGMIVSEIKIEHTGKKITNLAHLLNPPNKSIKKSITRRDLFTFSIHQPAQPMYYRPSSRGLMTRKIFSCIAAKTKNSACQRPFNTSKKKYEPRSWGRRRGLTQLD